ncbi:MAG: sulfotransferase domain-containing protein [Ferruginibacter sp.]
MSSSPSDEIQNWLPLKMAGHSLCQWLYAGNKSFTEPFFDDTISVCRKLEENRKPYKIVAGLQMMTEWSADMQVIPPSAIIFHVSRCGSTLLSQILSLDETNIVLSEVPFFDEVLRLPFKTKPIETIAVSNYLGAAIKCYSRVRTGKERHLFIKTDSWHLHFYSLIRTLYPAVPFILLYRDPGEVILSQQRLRGMHSVPGVIEPGVFGFSKEQINEPNLDMHMANVLAGYFRKMIEITKADPLVLPINYATGISGIMQKIIAFTGLKATKQSEEFLNERSRFNAKYPRELFKEKNKQWTTPGYLLPVLQLYSQLDTLANSDVD